MSELSSTKLEALIWYLGTFVALAGVISARTVGRTEGTMLLTVGGGLLGALLLRSTWQVRRTNSGRVVGGPVGIILGALILFGGVGLGFGLVPESISSDVRIAALATGAQVFLGIVAVHPTTVTRTTRWIVPAGGHAAVIFGTALTLKWMPYASRTVLLVYTVGFSFLILHTFWMRLRADERVVPARPDTPGRRWSVMLTVAIVAGVIASAVAEFAVTAGSFGFVVRSDRVLANVPVARVAATVVGGAAVVGFASLASPPNLPKVFDVFTGTTNTVVQHALTLIVLVNALLVAGLVVAPIAYPVVLGLFLVFLVVSVLMEYLSVVHGRRTLRQREESDSAPPPLADASVTIVVSAFNDAEVLRESLDHNLAEWDDVPFIVIPAVRSRDGTVEVAKEFEAEYPDQVSVIEGTGGSKAADLNLAWEEIDTEYVLLLDSDETADAGFIARGVDTFQQRPEVGVVQGRKVSENPGRDTLSRFTSVERQQSTWLEHPYMDARFDAAHFGGSVALLRREVPPSVDGWRHETLTEDIDFTVRLQLDSDWRVAYDTGMVARESTPQTIRGLIRQRQRWTRGWAEVAESYLTRILSSSNQLGSRRTAGFTWLLFTSISAPLATIAPALLFMGLGLFAGVSGFPLAVSLALGLFLLPARGISFGYAAFRDPEIPLSAGPRNVLRVLFYGYLWIIFGWIVQIHSLYLELAGAPNVWQVTVKRARGVPARPRGRFSESAAVFEVYRDRGDEWRWRLVHRNGNIISDSGEGYERREGCITGLESVKRTVSDAETVSIEKGDSPRSKTVGSDGSTFEMYRDKADEWRWRLVHDNGNIVADSGEGYERVAGANKGLNSVVKNAPHAPVVDLTQPETDSPAKQAQ